MKQFDQITEELSNIVMTDVFAITKKYKTDAEFSQYIESMAMRNGDTLIETILGYCDLHDVDEVLIAKLLSPSLKDKILVEAQESKLMASTTGTLDI